jgi:quercetin dioxygenase-like cupin family protein
MKPYQDNIISEDTKIRIFDENIDPIELMWHRDLKTRQITILEGIGWSYQQEDSLPKQLNPGDQIVIPALEWHRVIKGTTNLKLKIEEY